MCPIISWLFLWSPIFYEKLLRPQLFHDPIPKKMISPNSSTSITKTQCSSRVMWIVKVIKQYQQSKLIKSNHLSSQQCQHWLKITVIEIFYPVDIWTIVKVQLVHDCFCVSCLLYNYRCQIESNHSLIGHGHGERQLRRQSVGFAQNYRLI